MNDVRNLNANFPNDLGVQACWEKLEIKISILNSLYFMYLKENLRRNILFY